MLYGIKNRFAISFLDTVVLRIDSCFVLPSRTNPDQPTFIPRRTELVTTINTPTAAPPTQLSGVMLPSQSPSSLGEDSVASTDADPCVVVNLVILGDSMADKMSMHRHLVRPEDFFKPHKVVVVLPTEELPDTIDGAYIVYDVCARESFERVGHWLKLLEKKLGKFVSESQTLAAVVGNHLGPLSTRVVTVKEATHFTLTHKLLFCDVLDLGLDNLHTLHSFLVNKIIGLKCNELGRGAQGSVLHGQLGNGVQVAVKTMKSTPNVRAGVEEEVKLLRRCQHPNIVRLFGANVTSDKIEIILKLYPKGSLVTQMENGTWHPSMTPRIVRQVIEAVHLLHTKGVMHRDIKPGNILLSDEGDAILCDFGIACERQPCHTIFGDARGNDSSVGTLSFMAPEMCATTPNYGYPVDVWAIGCLILELLGYCLWRTDTEDLRTTIAGCTGMPDGCPGEAECTRELWQVLTGIFQRDPESRITCEALLQLPWFQHEGWATNKPSDFLISSSESSSESSPPILWTPIQKTAGTIAEAYMTPQQLHIHTLEGNPNDSQAWYSLGKTVPQGGAVVVGGAQLTQQHCFIRALENDFYAANVWLALGETFVGERVAIGETTYTQQDCFAHAASIDSRNASCWYNLGNVLSDNREVNIGNTTYNQQACYIRALEIDPSMWWVWFKLTATFDRGSEVTIHNELYTKQACYVRALVTCPEPPSWKLWAGLALTLPNHLSTVSINGATYNQQACYIRALEIDPSIWWVWFKLAATLDCGSEVTIHNELYTKQACYVRILTMEPGNTKAWCALGSCIREVRDGDEGSQDEAECNITVNGTSYDERACYTHALSIDPSCPTALSWLAHDELYSSFLQSHAERESAELADNEQYIRRLSLIRSLEENEEDAIAWNNLGETGDCMAGGYSLPGDEVTVKGVVYTFQNCFVRALEINPRLATAWRNLANVSRGAPHVVTINNAPTEFTCRECHLRALQCDPMCGACWCDLGQTLQRGECVSVNGTLYNSEACYLQGLQYHPDAPTWHLLGGVLSEGAHFGGLPLTKPICYARAVEMDPKRQRWWLLGEALSEGDVVDVTGPGKVPITVNKRDCFVHALEADLDEGEDDTDVSLWGQLGDTLAEDDVVTVNGAPYTKEACYALNQGLGPYSGGALRSLGDATAEGGVVIESPIFQRERESYVQLLEDGSFDGSWESWVEFGSLIPRGGHVTARGIHYTQQACYIRALEINPSHKGVWNVLGRALFLGDVVRVNGEHCGQRECFARAVGGRDHQPWVSLGDVLSGVEEVIICGDPYTKRDCYIRALEIEIRDAGAWSRLGDALQEGEEVAVEDELCPTQANCNRPVFTKRACYIRALEIDSSKAKTWGSLGDTLSDTDSVKIRRDSYAQCDCYIRALEIDGESDDVWARLGDLLSSGGEAIVNGIPFTQRACYIRALDINMLNTKVWVSLGDLLVMGEQVIVKGNLLPWSKQSCFSRALEINPLDRSVWARLGSALPARTYGRFHGRDVTREECFEHAMGIKGPTPVPAISQDVYIDILGVDPFNHVAWEALGDGIHEEMLVTVKGATYTKHACYTRALEIDESDGRRWYELGVSLPANYIASVNRSLHSKEACFIRALEASAPDVRAWSKLADTMSADSVVTIKDTYNTRKSCYVRALEIAPSDGVMWYNLATTLQRDERVSINDVQLSKCACFVASLKINGKNASTWCGLGDALLEGEEVMYDRLPFTKQACFIRALTIDPDRGAAWRCLGGTIRAGEKVDVFGEQFTSQMCLDRAQRADAE